jgi:NADPH:quinone reductase-like Zn-dependent oxidoreductase
VCSTTKTGLVRSLGAAHVIDYTQDDFADGARRYDLIIDIAGNPALSRLRHALTPAGTGMGRQFRALALSPFLHQRRTMLTPRQRASDLERITEFLEAGTVIPSISATYPLHQVRQAMHQLAAGQARGKVAITI